MNVRLFLSLVLVYTAAFLSLAASVSAETKLVGQNKDWSAYANDQNCWVSSTPIKSVTSRIRDGKLVQIRRGDVLMFANRQATGDGDLWFSYSPGYPVDPSKNIRMFIDGQLFYLKRINTDQEAIFAQSLNHNTQILNALARGLKAEIISESVRGTRVSDTFSLMGFTASARASVNECQTRSEKQSTADSEVQNSNQKRATGGGEVRVMEVVMTERKSRGKLDACELSYILAFEDYIYRNGAITFLRGSLNFAGFTADTDRNPAFLFKVTAFDLLAEGHKLAPLEYAYLSTNNISYAGNEYKIIDASDGGLVIAYDIANSSLNFAGPLTLNIMRKGGRNDVAVPVDFMEADPDAGVRYAACMLNLLEVLSKELN